MDQAQSAGNVTAVSPFAAHDGAKPVHYLRPGYIASNMLKKAPPERSKEVLRIMNWLAAPFGSAEDLLLTVGVKDVDYTLDSAGNALPTDRSNADANLVNWKYHVQHPQVAYATGCRATPNSPRIMRRLPFRRYSGPVWGMVSSTWEKRGVSLNQTVLDGLTDIVASRRPLSDLEGISKSGRPAVAT